ncbi:hypothetical protein NX059_009432 [Plenodomus lindquistii]|nr:hypothetical protein NX059_009432 [Plenodomus lindquistii]
MLCYGVRANDEAWQNLGRHVALGLPRCTIPAYRIPYQLHSKVAIYDTDSGAFDRTHLCLQGYSWPHFMNIDTNLANFIPQRRRVIESPNTAGSIAITADWAGQFYRRFELPPINQKTWKSSLIIIGE